jgi:cytidylate kinase
LIDTSIIKFSNLNDIFSKARALEFIKIKKIVFLFLNFSIWLKIMNYYTLIPFLVPYEKELCSNLRIHSPTDLSGPVIAIGGYAGVGKDTLAINIRDRLKSIGINLKIYGSGQHIREYAKRTGYSEAHLDDFLYEIKNDESFALEVDHFVDKQTLAQALGRGQGIFIGRMAPFVVGKWGMTIWVTVNPKTRADRLVTDPNRPEHGLSKDEVFQRIEKRDANDQERLQRIYNVDLLSLVDKLDLLLDNSENTINQSENLAYQTIINKYPQILMNI